jgi:hypothetical protein
MKGNRQDLIIKIISKVKQVDFEAFLGPTHGGSQANIGNAIVGMVLPLKGDSINPRTWGQKRSHVNIGRGKSQRAA